MKVFVNETIMLSHLNNSEYIPKYYGSGICIDQYFVFIVLEFTKENDLFTFIKKNHKTLTFKQYINIFGIYS